MRFTCVIGLDRDRDRNVSHQQSKETEASALVRRRPDIALRAHTSYRPEGKLYCRTFPPETREKVIKDWLAVQQSDIARDKWTDPDAGSETFRKYAETGLASGVRQKTIEATTATKYRGLLDRYLLLTFGNLQLRKIRPREVHDWYDELFALKVPTAAGRAGCSSQSSIGSSRTIGGSRRPAT